MKLTQIMTYETASSWDSNIYSIEDCVLLLIKNAKSVGDEAILRVNAPSKDSQAPE